MINCTEYVKADVEVEDETPMEVQEALLETPEGVHKVQIIGDYNADYQIVSQKEEAGEGEEHSYEIEVIQDTSNFQELMQATPVPTKRKTKTVVRRETRIKEESDPATAEQIKNAMDDIIHNKISFQTAAERYGVSKTLLWRLCQTSQEYHTNRHAHNNPELNNIILDSLKSGETLLSISKKYNVPVSTLHRRKSMLYEQGELPENVRIKQRNRGEDFSDRLQRAINDVSVQGMSQTEAAKKYRIPKTTIWRRLRGLAINEPKYKQALNATAEPNEEEVIDESFTFATTAEEIIIGHVNTSSEEICNEPQVKFIKIAATEDEEHLEPTTETEDNS